MSTLSVPLTPALEVAIERLVKMGFGETKAEVVRKAIAKMSEEEAINAVVLSQKDATDGKLFEGDLRALVNAIT